MTTYIPDTWAVVKIRLAGSNTAPYYKILAGWRGGYATGDSWKLSSGCEGITKDEFGWHIPQSSGSLYSCREFSEGLSAYTESVFKDIFDKLTKDDVFEIVSVEELVNHFKGNNIE